MSTFVELQDLTLAGSFPSSKRDLVKSCLNASYGGLFDQEEWSFTQASEPVKVTAGSQAVSEVSASFGVALDLFRADGTPLERIEEYRNFAARYVGTNLPRGLPEAFTAVGTDIFVGPTSSETSTSYLLVYEKAVTLLVADDNVPVIPAQYHVGLVFAAKAMVHGLSDEVLAAGFAAQAEAIFAPMRRKYLRSMRGTATQARAYRPGG